MDNGLIKVEAFSSDVIEVLGNKYYREDRLIKEQNRSYREGFEKGTQKHIAVFETPSPCPACGFGYISEECMNHIEKTAINIEKQNEK